MLLKNRDITLLTKVCIVKAMVFPVVMHSCESWTIKEAGHQRTDAFVDHLRCISISTITLQQIQHPGKVGYSEIPPPRTIQEQGFINAFEEGRVHIHLDHPTPPSESL